MNNDDNKIDVSVRFMQNELNALLNSFLNGGFSVNGYLMYPLVKGISQENMDRVRRLKEVAAFLDKNGYDFKSSVKEGNPANAKEFASSLSAFYKDLYSIKFKRNKKKIASCTELSFNAYDKNDADYLMPLQELKDYASKYLRNYLAGFYLHGSFATNDYVKGWSDVDTFGIVSENAINNPKSLIELRDRIYCMRYFFYKIDPLQHHGTILISEYDLDNYCPAYFPLDVLKYAKSFFSDRFRYAERDFSMESLDRLKWFMEYFKEISKKKEIRLNSYDSKNLLHRAALFPSLYLQAKGVITYKKFSFAMAKKDFSRKQWQVIDYISAVRENWKEFPRLPLADVLSKINPLLFHQLNFRIADFVRGDINKINSKKVTEGMLKLSEEAWRKVNKNVKV